MKNCRTIKGLLQAIKNGESACLKITSLATKGSGNHLIGVGVINKKIYEISDDVYQNIKPYLIMNW